MKSYFGLGLAMIAGIGIGAASFSGLNAQGKAPGAYVIVAFSDIGDPAGFKTAVLDKAGAVVEKHGGRVLVRTTDITELRAAEPPIKRWVLIGFDSAQQAKDWYTSADNKPIDEYQRQHTKGRVFLVQPVQ